MAHQADLMQVFGTINIITGMPYKVKYISFLLKIKGHFIIDIVQQSNHSNGRSWIYRPIGILIIKTHITTCNRRIKFATGLSHSLYGMNELIINFRIIRITEIE